MGLATVVAAGPRGPLGTSGVARRCPYLLGEPDAAGLCHPFSGVDAGVDPDGWTVRPPFAELEEQRWGGPALSLSPLWPPPELQILTLST